MHPKYSPREKPDLPTQKSGFLRSFSPRRLNLATPLRPTFRI